MQTHCLLMYGTFNQIYLKMSPHWPLGFIAECQGERNPNANTCIKLAAFYTIRNEMFGTPVETPVYSRAAPPQERIELDSNSEFTRLVSTMDPGVVWAVVDELMSTLQVINPRLYAGVIQKLEEG